MDRREAALWQVRQARRDLLIHILTATVAVIVGTVLLVAAARAEDFNVRLGATPGFQSCAGGTCVWGDLPTTTGPKIIQVPQDNSEEAQARERDWLNVCAPTFRRDQFGVTHYVYEKAGCEYGSPK